MRELACALLLAVAGGASAGTAPGLKAAALACANPQLPPAILGGANGAVSGDLAATPLRTISVSGTGTTSTTTLTLAVAADDRTRERGLMCVTALKPAAGMIFVFATANDWDFWMKSTVIPLDMIWLAVDGTVTRVAANVPASTLETPDERVARRSGYGRYVIELRAGEAVADHIVRGARLTVPALTGT